MSYIDMILCALGSAVGAVLGVVAACAVLYAPLRWWHYREYTKRKRHG